MRDERERDLAAAWAGNAASQQDVEWLRRLIHYRRSIQEPPVSAEPKSGIDFETGALASRVHNTWIGLGRSREALLERFEGARAASSGWGLLNKTDVACCIGVLPVSHGTGCLDIEASGRFAASAEGADVLLWDLDRARCVGRLTAPCARAPRVEFEACRFSPDAAYLALSTRLHDDESSPATARVEIWDRATLDCVASVDGPTLTDPTSRVGIAWLDCGKLAFCHPSGDVGVLHTDGARGERARLPGPLLGPIALHADLVAALTEHGCLVWDHSRHTVAFTVQMNHAMWCGFAPDGASLAVGGPTGVKVVRTSDGSLLATRDTSATAGGQLLRDGRLLAFSGAHLQLTDLRTSESAGTFESREAGGMYHVAVDRAERLALTRGDGRVYVWSLEAGSIADASPRHAEAVLRGDVDPATGMACTMARDGSVFVWDTRTGTLLRRAEPVGFGDVRFVRDSDDATQLAVLAGGRLRMIAPETGTTLREEILVDTEKPPMIRFAEGQPSPLTSDGPWVLEVGGEMWRGSPTLGWAKAELPVMAQFQVADSARAVVAYDIKKVLHVRVLEGGDWMPVARGVRAFSSPALGTTAHFVDGDGALQTVDLRTGETRPCSDVVVGTSAAELVVDEAGRTLWVLAFDAASPFFGGVTNKRLIRVDLKRGTSTIRELADSARESPGCVLPDGRLLTTQNGDPRIRIFDLHARCESEVILSTCPTWVWASSNRILVGDERGQTWILAPLDV